MCERAMLKQINALKSVITSSFRPDIYMPNIMYEILAVIYYVQFAVITEENCDHISCQIKRSRHTC